MDKMQTKEENGGLCALYGQI